MKITAVLVATVWLMLGCTTSATSSSSIQDSVKAQEYIDQGVILLRQNNLVEAEAAFYLAQQIADSATAIDGRGCVYFISGDIAEAERLFNQSAALDPTYLPALSHLALVYEQQGRRSEAKELLERVLILNPEAYDARNNLAALLVDNGAKQAIIKAQDQLVQASIVVKHPVLMDNLERIYDYEKQQKN